MAKIQLLLLTCIVSFTACSPVEKRPFFENKSSKTARKPFLDMSSDELKKHLTPLQYRVAKENGTEPPFDNEYWDNKEEGIYVDIISGEPLFSSIDKYESGTGWPSFFQTINGDEVLEKKDNSHFMSRVEVRGKTGDTHLGHLFPDGPKPTGLRYCINSAALRFIPKEELENEGYGDLLKLFE